MATPAKIRINVRAPFPAQVKGAAFIEVAKANGVWTLTPDYRLLALAPAITPSQITAVYDTAIGVWSYVPVTDFTGGGTDTDTLAALTDVQVSPGPGTDGYSLTWSQSTGKWVAALIADTDTLATLTDVNVTEGPAIDGYSLTWNNASGKWVATLIAEAPDTLATLADVNVAPGPGIDGYSLTFNNSTSKWIATLVGSGTITSAAMSTWFATLPTTLPGTPGQPWNNGNNLSFS